MAVTLTPYQDPSFVAFLRSMGVEESEIAGEVHRRTSALTRGLARRDPVYGEEKQEGLESTGLRAEESGLYRSGARLVAQQRLSNKVDRARLEDHTGVRDQVADLHGGAAREVAALRRRRAETELGARESVAVDAAHGGVY